MLKLVPRLLAFLCLSAAGLFGGSAGKQTGVIRFPVLQARQIAPPGSPPDLYWVVTELPRAADIDVPDAQVKQALVKLFDRLRAETHPWHLRRGSTWNLLWELSRGPLAQYSIALNRPSPYTQRPAGGAAASAQIEISYLPAVPPPIHELQVEVWSAGYLQEVLDQEKRRNNEPAPPARATEDFELETTIPNSRGIGRALQTEVQTNGKAVLQKAYLHVAVAALGIARKNGLTAGAVMDDSARARCEEEITNSFAVRAAGPADIRWPAPQAKIETSGEGVWFVKVRGAAVARNATIRVLPGSRFTVLGKDKAALQEAEMQRVRDRLNRRYSDLLGTFRDSVPARGQIEAVAGLLDVDPEVEGRANPVAGGPNGSELVFQVTNHWVIFGFSLKGGIAYSPEAGATGNVDFAADNLLRLTNEKRGSGDLEDFEFQGGYDRRFARGTMNVTKEARSWTLGAGIGADYLFDRNQAFGNLPEDRLEDREVSAGPRLTTAYRSPDAGKDFELSQHRYSLQWGAGFDWRDTAVRAASGPALPAASGVVLSFYSSLDAEWRYERPSQDEPGLGSVAARIHAAERKGLAAADFPFNQVLVTADVTAQFGFSCATDLLVHFRQGAGTTTGHTPLYHLFRLGGAEVLRGIEQGEFVGRQIAYQQMEAGVSARWVASWFHSSPGSGRSPGPMDLSRFYVKGFYDRGRVLDGASAGEILGFVHAMKGYGIALELRGINAGSKRLNLTFGYARSPDSVRHTSGVVITGVSIEF